MTGVPWDPDIQTGARIEASMSRMLYVQRWMFAKEKYCNVAYGARGHAGLVELISVS